MSCAAYRRSDSNGPRLPARRAPTRRVRARGPDRPARSLPVGVTPTVGESVCLWIAPRCLWHLCDPRRDSTRLRRCGWGRVAWASENCALWGQMSARTVEVPDGRMLAFEEVGDPAGAPVFVLHGTPGCRLSGRHPDLSRVRAAGLRLVTYDRPGYGRSTRQPGRRVVDCVSDVAAIADELDIERFAVSGGSGGGARRRNL
jgi:hypothetical protein